MFYKNISLISLSQYLIIIIPIAFIFSNAISDILLVLVSVICIYLLLNNSCLKDYFCDKTFIFLSIFTFYLLISSFLSGGINEYFLKSFLYLRFIVFAICAKYVADNSKNFFKFFSISLLLVVFVFFIDTILIYFTSHNIFGDHKDTYLRISSFFNDELILGSYLSKIIPFILIANYLLKKNSNLNLIIIFLSSIIVLMTGERVASFNLILFNILFLFCTYNFKKFITILIPILLVIIFSLFLSEKINKRFIQITSDQINSTNFNFATFSPHHEKHYLTAIEIFKDHKIFGAGPYSFRHLCHEKNYSHGSLSCSTHPHNNFIQLLSETGLIGFSFLFFAYIFILFQFFKYFFRKKNYQNNLILLTTGIILILLNPILPSQNFFGQVPNILFYYLVFFYIYIKSYKNSNHV